MDVAIGLIGHHMPKNLDYKGLATNCIPAAFDLASRLKNSNDQEAVVNQRSDGMFPYTYDSQVFSNCTATQVSGTYSYSLPVVLVVGQLDANNQLQPLETYVEPLPSVPTSSSYKLFPPKGADFTTGTDAQLIAKKLYTDQGFPDKYFNPTGQPSDSFSLILPANSQVQLHLPLNISYRIGNGEVNHNGQAGPGMEWTYTYAFQRNFDSNNLTQQQMTVTPCS
ncbi:MAG: hypothetical protein NVSMB38_39350 [Ktedonobacteraceae bacterium]